jgi:nucleotide-binding universal stress UspA family protein
MKLLVALQASDNDVAIIAPSGELARTVGADVTLLHVVNPMTDASNIVAFSRAEAMSQLVSERQAYLERFAAQYDPRAKTRVEQLAHGEDVPNGIARVAHEENADILVIATNRASGVRGLILGSVAQHLLRLSPCPILVVRVD